MSSSVCVDASLILRTLIPAPYSSQALAHFSQWQNEGIQLIAPALLPFEVTSVLRRLVFLRELTARDGDLAFATFCRMTIRLFTQPDLFSLAWRLAKEWNCPRAYDTAYLAVAQLHGVEFWTADEKLYHTVAKRLPWVRWVGEKI